MSDELKKEKKPFRLRAFFGGLTLMVVLALVLVVNNSVQSQETPENEVLVGLARYLKSNPVGKAADKAASALSTLAELALGGAADEEVAGRAVTPENIHSNFYGIGLVDKTNIIANKFECRTEKFPKSTSTIVSDLNTSGESLLVYRAEIILTTTPSASIVISLGTSTVSGVVFNAGAVATNTLPNGIFDRYYIATNTRTGLAVSNYFNGTSTLFGSFDAGSVLHGPQVVGSNSVAGANPTLRVGRSIDPIVEVRPGEYLVGHLELGQYGSGSVSGANSQYHLAVTTTVSSSPATDATSVRLRQSGDIGAQGFINYCFSRISTSTIN